ncbi:hypothetical protein SDC9_163512 [bioreactor metagenome]|uniref:Uncharacterized protein n=1 Tax=bioreactor metagenome TaxID=1076179 RepID=A0A645FVV8_9ZZZZ
MVHAFGQYPEAAVALPEFRKIAVVDEFDAEGMSGLHRIGDHLFDPFEVGRISVARQEPIHDDRVNAVVMQFPDAPRQGFRFGEFIETAVVGLAHGAEDGAAAPVGSGREYRVVGRILQCFTRCGHFLAGFGQGVA